MGNIRTRLTVQFMALVTVVLLLFSPLAGMVPAYERLDAMEAPGPATVAGRTAGRAPMPEENPYNAWAWMGPVEGAATGPLAGCSVGVATGAAAGAAGAVRFPEKSASAARSAAS